MSNIFTLMDDAELTQDEVLKSELFCQQFLEGKFPDVDFRQGTGVRDMVIRPSAILLASINKAVTTYFSNMSIKDITDSTPEEMADKILSNYFIERKQGTNTIIKARLYFAFPGNMPANVQIPSNSYFSTDNERKYYPKASLILSPPVDVKLPNIIYLQFDSAEELWYADVDLQAEKPDLTYDLDTGDLIYFTIFNPYFIKGEILYLSANAVVKETNVQMIERSYSAISTRNLINDPSITSRLNDVFNFIKSIRVVGMGDTDMYRDRVKVDNPLNLEEKVGFSIGGKVDVYCHVEPVTQIIQFTTDVNGDIYIPGSVFAVSRSPISGNLDGTADTIPYAKVFTTTMSNCSAYVEGVPTDPIKDVGLSARQILKISFGNLYPHETASLVVKRFGGIQDIQDFTDSDRNRVVSADYLIRSFEPVIIKINAQTHTTPPVDLATFNEEIRQYIDSIPNGGDLYMSTIYGIMNSCGITDVVVPINVQCTSITKGLEMFTMGLVDSYKLKSTSRFVYDGLSISKVGG